MIDECDFQIATPQMKALTEINAAIGKAQDDTNKLGQRLLTRVEVPADYRPAPPTNRAARRAAKKK